MVSVRYMLKNKPWISNPDPLKIIVLLLFFFIIAGVMSFLLFNALTYGVATGMGRYDTGKAVLVSQDPAGYWMLVVIYYSAAVAALSIGLGVGARPTRNWLTRKTGPQMNGLGMRRKVKLTLELYNEFVDSPSAEKLAQALATFGHPDGNNFAILRRSEESCIQTDGNLSKGFMIEYREGSDYSHRGGIPHSEMVKAFLAYHRGSEEWKGMYEWNKGAADSYWNKGPDDSPAKPFTRRWIIATIVYFAGAVIALYVYSKGDGGWDMPLVLPPFVFLAPIFVSLGLLAIYTDEFQIKNSTFYRSKSPILFWVCVAMMLFLGIGMFLYGIGVIGPWNENLGRR